MRRTTQYAHAPGPTLALRESGRSRLGTTLQNPASEHFPGNQATLRRLSHSTPIVRRDPPADAKKAPPAAAPAPGPAPSPTPDAAKTDEVKLTIPWDEILKGNTTLMQVLMPGIQPPAGAGPATPAPATPAGGTSPTPKGPTAGGASPAPAAPTATPAGPAPDAPSRLSLKDFGNLSLGLRLGFPDMKGADTGPDGAPSALQQSIQTGEIINYSMTGKLPSAYQLDKGKLVGACWGIFSKYIAPDVAAKIAKGMSGKVAGGSMSYELDGVLLPDFSGGGVSFTLRFGGSKSPARSSPPVQPKLKVGSTTDPLEAEADRAADQVMRMPGSAAAGTLQRKCAACDEEDKKVHTKNNGQSQAEGDAPAIVGQALNSSGQALDANTRAFFEKRFDADFSGVRIHTDSLAAQSADAVQARAYATGNHIVLGAGETANPSRLLAHELAHVVQQQGAGARASAGCESSASPAAAHRPAARSILSRELANSLQQGRQRTVRRIIRSSTNAPLDAYLKGKQIFTFTSSGNAYSMTRGTKGTFAEQEVLLDMLASARLFELAGDTSPEAEKSLTDHVTARLGIVTFASQKKYKFASVSGFTMNPQYWITDPATLSYRPKPGVDKQTAWDDLNVHPELYAIGCFAATDITQAGGAKTGKFRNQPTADENDWVPGDAGYVANPNQPKNADPGTLGENIIYVGSGQFWGHLSDDLTYRTLAEWKKVVARWNGASQVDSKRDGPDTGLL